MQASAGRSGTKQECCGREKLTFLREQVEAGENPLGAGLKYLTQVSSRAFSNKATGSLNWKLHFVHPA